jgi:cytoskeletal protein RodZ
MLAQIDAATSVTGAATSILSDRSDAMVILVGMIALAGFWLWKVHMPRQQFEQKLREADKAIHQSNANTLEELSKVTTTVHQTTTHSNTTLRAMVEVKEIELDCIGRVAEKAQCDISSQLAEARGVLRAVRAGATE